MSTTTLAALRSKMIHVNNKPCWYASGCGLILTEISDGFCSGYLDITGEQFDFSGRLPSGILYTAMDDVAGMAAAGSGTGCVTMTGTASYHLPVTVAGRLQVQATLESFDGTIRVFRAIILRDDTLVASGIFTFFSMEDLISHDKTK